MYEVIGSMNGGGTGIGRALVGALVIVLAGAWADPGQAAGPRKGGRKGRGGKAGKRAARARPTVRTAADRVLDKHWKLFLKHKKSPRAAVHLMGLERLRSKLHPQALDRFVARAKKVRGVHPLTAFWLSRLELQGLLAAGKFGGARKLAAAQGFATRAMVVGPFDNEGGRGFGKAYGPERMDGVRPKKTFTGKERTVGWRWLPGLNWHGQLRPSAVLRPIGNGVVYLALGIEARRSVSAALRVGSGCSYKIWLDRRLVASKRVKRPLSPDQDAHRLEIRKGLHVLKVKLAAQESSWHVYLRLTDTKGRALKRVKWFAAPARLERASAMMGPSAVPSKRARRSNRKRASTSRAKTVTTIEGTIRGRIAKRPKDVSLRLDLVRYLLHVSPEDPTKEGARNEALALAKLQPKPASYRLLARASPRTADRLEALHKAYKLDPTQSKTLLLLGRQAFSRGKLVEAERYLKLALKYDPGLVTAQILRAELLSARGLQVLARKNLSRVLKTAGWRHDVAKMLAEAAADTGQKKRARKLLSRIVRENLADVGARRILVQHALDRLDLKSAEHHLRALVKSSPYDVELLTELADLLASNRRHQEAARLLIKAIGRLPDEPDLHVSLGRCYFVAGRKREALKAWKKAAALRPQDQSLRRRLALLEAAAPDELVRRYAVKPRTVIRSVTATLNPGMGAAVLWDRTVIRVHANGLAHRFRQRLVKILNNRGAREHASWTINYQPDSQQLRCTTTGRSG
jgi:tetratricopeptide (TPR) repeat protein